MFVTPRAKPCTREVRYDVALRKGAACEDDTTRLEPLFFTFVVSNFAASLSTRVLRIVAKELLTKVKNEGSVTYVRNSKGETLYT